MVGRLGWRVCIGGVLTLVLCAYYLKISAPDRFFRAEVVGASMEPTLRCARGPGCSNLTPDILFVRKSTRGTKFFRDEIVLVRPHVRLGVCGHGAILVKRIVGIAGETIGGSRAGLRVNERIIKEKYLDVPSNVRFPVVRLRPRAYFLLGDNRAVSCDSREFGPVTKNEIVGVVTQVERGIKG
jgi:signal peptidase I